MDRLGRRPLLFLSSIVVALTMTSNGLFYHFKSGQYQAILWTTDTPYVWH